ncbi:MAG TPA: hypothetical protein DCZ43_10825 [candidate division Zixibacteria bacterium]|nr:hypothetical protein [candidate division Zixibacteria bacterium]
MDNRRRQFFVSAGGQRSLLAGVFILILVLVVVVSGLFYILANRDLEKATYRAHFETLRNTMQMLLPWLVLVNAIGLIVVLILAIFFTHKIAGPAYHLQQDLKKIKEGDLTIRTAFRKGDGLKDVAEAMNDTTGQLRLDIANIKDKVDDLSKVTGNEALLKEKLDMLRETLDKLKT